MKYAYETLLAAELADQWIESILGEQPDLVLTPDGEDASPALMAQNLAEFRLHLIEALEDQPLSYYADDEDEGEDEDGTLDFGEEDTAEGEDDEDDTDEDEDEDDEEEEDGAGKKA